MPLIVSGSVGEINTQDGAAPAAGFRQARQGDLMVSELQARYYEQTYRKRVFTAYATGVLTSLVGTAMVGLQLYNGSPIYNGVNLVLMKVQTIITATAATMTQIALTAGTGQLSAPTGQTAATKVQNNLIGGSAPQALATNAATFTNAPTAFWPLLHNTAAIATTGEDAGAYMDLEGSIIIPPQCFFAFAAVGLASGGSSHGVMWMEVPA
jgi:hypothetical protein